MTQEKIDYPPLLPGGIHDYTLDSLKPLAVDKFPDSARRKGLFGALGIYLEMLEATGFKGSAWIDGSFMCNKEEPEDIDLVLVYESESLDNISESARPVLNGLFDTLTIKTRFNLHVFQVRTDDERGVEYWKRFFGTQRDEVTPKGLASIGVNL
ncbi:hypothetical protein YA0850_29695 [Pseudomonas veronii]|uniref:Polymerase nucleotidyl transferase domain-containing protein n=1 Tax=Pseudomonas veronii TaxID=76761 RepID=A0ABS0VEE9_PSEVE|nr:hypothetical protein [Pseudomonas veronii]MBI6556540.1 hypothetical protein [Pseudomonas veronii]MBI6649862.1 hypothetical protein [Pseudomonas veronii]